VIHRWALSVQTAAANNRPGDVRPARSGDSGYAALMIEEERAEETSSAEMSEAIESIKSSSPGLAEALGSSGVTPGKLADAHHKASPEGQDHPPEQG
jgi:hypothetical protein